MLTEVKKRSKNRERKVLCGAAVSSVFIFLFCRRKIELTNAAFLPLSGEERKKFAFISAKAS